MKKNELKELVKEEIQNIINEFDIKDGNDDNEGEMSKSELLYIADKAGKIAEKITADDQPIEAWAQSHISAAKELISHVADYVGYGEEEAGEEGTEEIEDNEEAGQEVDSKSIVEPDGLNEVQSEKQKAAFAKMLAAKNPKKKSKEEPNKPKEEKEKKELKEENMQEEVWMAAFDTAIDRDMNLSPKDKELVSRALDHVNPFMNYRDMNPAEAAAEFIEDVLYSQEANDDYDTDYTDENVVNEDKKASAKKGSKPDFLDLDKDGDKKEPMKKAAKEGMGNEVGDKVYFKGDLGEKYPSSQGYYGIIEDTTPARNYNMMATYEVVVYDKNDNEIRTIKTDFTNLTSKAVNETAELKEMTQSALDKKKKTQFSSKYDDKFSDKRKNLPDSLQKSILKKQGNLEEDSKKELTVKKLQADKFKEDIKDFAANNEHGKILKLIKKLEDYVKTHKSKGEN